MMTIENHMQHELALSCITELMQHDPSPGTHDGDHLMEIANAVEVFEEKHFCLWSESSVKVERAIAQKTESKVAHYLADQFLTEIWDLCAEEDLDTHRVLKLVYEAMRTCYGESIGFREG